MTWYYVFIMHCLSSSFLFNGSAPTKIYTLSLHDALPICHIKFNLTIPLQQLNGLETLVIIMVANKYAFLIMTSRSEERFSRNDETDLVCRLLLEKKKESRQSKRVATTQESGPRQHQLWTVGIDMVHAIRLS